MTVHSVESAVDARGRLRHTASRFAAPLVVLGLVVVWEVAATAMVLAEVPLATSKLPAPHRVVTEAVVQAPLLGSSLWVTARGALIGLCCGTLLGVVVALVVSQSRWLEDATYPYIIGGQMIPTIALAPIILTAIQNATATRILVATYITFFPVSLGTLKGLKSTTHDALDLMRSYNASRVQVYRKLRFPGALPHFFTGFKVAAPLSVVGEIVVELTGATSGLGYLILVTQYYGPTYAALFWASMVVTLLLGLLFYVGAARLERALSPWQQEFRVR